MFYQNLTNKQKIAHHNYHLLNAESISSIIYAQTTCVCIRNIKQASAHKNLGINVHLFYSGKSPNDFYGYGDEYYKSITKVSKKTTIFWKNTIKKLINKTEAQLIHTHNEPDLLPMKMIQYDLGIPIIYDQHDFLSAKKNLSSKFLNHEKICNEKNDGAIYITNQYKNLVSEKYSINSLNIEFPNFGSKELLIPEKKILTKKSKQSSNIHLVYEGGLDDQKPNITRYLIPQIKKLSELGFHIDLYPSKNDTYYKYKSLKNVTVHKKLSPKRLIKELSQYDFGLTIVNPECDNMSEELKYGFWNKCFDYLLAGIPQITFNQFETMSNFISINQFGFSIKTINDLYNNHNLTKTKQKEFIKSIISNRKEWLMDKKISKMHTFYIDVIKNYHKNKIKKLTK